MLKLPPNCKEVLLVEDNTLTILILESEFSKKGFSVDKATDGLAGWEACREKHYDLILIDLQMPLMDGKTLVQKIRKELDDNQGLVYAMSAGLSKSEIDELLRIGFDGYLQKPLNLLNKGGYTILSGQLQ